MTILPAAGYFSVATRTNAEAKTGQDDILAFIRERPGGQAESELTIAAGSVTPNMGVHSIDTELNAATDDLANLSTANLADGSLLLLHAQDTARDVVVKHQAGGAGQISLANLADFTLDDVDKWLLLKRTSVDWQELFRSYGNDKAAFKTNLGLGDVSNVKDNLAAPAAPTVNDDSAVGYAVGSTWMDVTNNSAYICLDSTVAAAVWSEITAVSSGATAAEKADIAQNGFLIASHQSLAGGNIANGWRDVFTDQTGVGTNTNGTYNGAGYYENPGVDAVISTSGLTPAGDMTANGGLVAAFDGVVAQATTASAWKSATNTGFIGVDWGGAVTKTITGVKMSAPTGGNGVFDNTTATGSITLKGSNSAPVFGGGANLGTLLSDGDIAAGTSLYVTSGITTTTAYRYHWIELNYTGATLDAMGMAELEFYEAALPPDMTLVSNAATALSAPTSATIMLWEEDIDAVIPNTDLKAYASRDSGVTWTQIILMISATLTTGRLLTGTVDISAQPAGTAMTYKIETLNATSMKIHGVQLSWS